MKLLVIGDRARTEKFLPDLPIVGETELVVVERGTSDEDILRKAEDADAILADAISPVSAKLIDGMPNLKMIHSEGVAFNAIDGEAAARRGIYVCNNRGVNAVAVAEQTLLLILGVLKHVVEGDAAVRAGRQIAYKEQLMVSGIEELSGMTVGLIGFGAIAREVAKRLNAFDADVVYTKRHRLDEAEERLLGVRYLGRAELLAASDIVSVHVPVTAGTRGMVDDAFFAQMKQGSYLVNTARGEIVDNEALVRVLASGKLSGAALDTVAPEPVAADNPLVTLPPELASHILFSPHIGGVTTNMFGRAHRCVWENLARVARGERPVNVVNGL